MSGTIQGHGQTPGINQSSTPEQSETRRLKPKLPSKGTTFNKAKPTSTKPTGLGERGVQIKSNDNEQIGEKSPSVLPPDKRPINEALNSEITVKCGDNFAKSTSIKIEKSASELWGNCFPVHLGKLEGGRKAILVQYTDAFDAIFPKLNEAGLQNREEPIKYENGNKTAKFLMIKLSEGADENKELQNLIYGYGNSGPIVWQASVDSNTLSQYMV